MKLVWIDHPNIRSYLKETQVKSVPCIVVHDEDRDISIIYENERFTDYLNNFIQQRQAKVQRPSPHLPQAAQTSQAPQAPHLSAMAHLPQFQQQHQQFTSQQQNMFQTLQKSQADLAAVQVQSQNPSTDHIRANISRQMFGTDEPPKQTSSSISGMKEMGQRLVENMKQTNLQQERIAAQSLPMMREQAFKQTETQNQMVQQQIAQQRAQMAREYEEKSQESKQLGLHGLKEELRKMPEYSALNDAHLTSVAQEKALSHEMAKLDQAQQRLIGLRQMHPDKAGEIDKELHTITQAKMALAQQRVQLPPVPLANKQQTILPPGKSEADRENYINLQQEKIESDVNLVKKAQQKNGITSIDDLLGDDSLYDQHVKRKGTDFHQSEAKMNTALSSTKRNSINQKVREMSQTRPVSVEMGAGHEQMAKSSIPVLPDKRPEFTPIDDVAEEEPFQTREPFESHDPFEAERIDADEPVVSSAVKKKKSSALDMAREMEKSRGMIDKEFQR
jgi:hypothetical protein